MQTKRISVYVANSTCQHSTPVLRHRKYMHFNRLHARRLILFRIRLKSVTTCAIGSVISPRPQWVLPCLSVTLSNIISLNLPSRFCIIDVIPRADWVIITENIIRRLRIRAKISTASRRLQNIMWICVRKSAIGETGEKWDTVSLPRHSWYSTTSNYTTTTERHTLLTHISLLSISSSVFNFLMFVF